MLLDHCYAVAVAFKSEEEGDPLDLFLPHPGSAPGRIWLKRLEHVRGHEFVIPTKFRKHPACGFAEKAECVPIHLHALVQPPFLNLNKYIKIN